MQLPFLPKRGTMIGEALTLLATRLIKASQTYSQVESNRLPMINYLSLLFM